MDSITQQPTKDYTYLTVDVAKDSLQVRLPAGNSLPLGNDKAAHERIIAEVRKARKARRQPVLVVVEATGGYEHALLAALDQKQIPWNRVHPDRVRAYARSQGQKAKTDRLDTELIFAYAQGLKVQPTPPPDPAVQALRELLDRRTQLVDLIALEKQHKEHARGRNRDSIERVIEALEEELAELEKAIEQHVKDSPALQAKFDRLNEVRGVGDKTAWAVLAYLPELPGLTRERAAALAGVAPYANDSGQSKGKRRCQGGRAKLRKVLYMSAMAGIRFNPHLREFYGRLVKRGKEKQVAVVAVMRKLLLHLRSVLKSMENPENALA